jgi:hypothetical protein
MTVFKLLSDDLYLFFIALMALALLIIINLMVNRGHQRGFM